MLPRRPMGMSSYTCRYCGGGYATRQAVSYHRLHRCPKRPGITVPNKPPMRLTSPKPAYTISRELPVKLPVKSAAVPAASHPPTTAPQCVVSRAMPVGVRDVPPAPGNVREMHRSEIPPSKSEPTPDTDSLSGFGALATVAALASAPRAGIPSSPRVGGDRIGEVVFWGLVLLVLLFLIWLLYCIFQDYNKQRTAASGTLAPAPAVQPAARALPTFLLPPQFSTAPDRAGLPGTACEFV